MNLSKIVIIDYKLISEKKSLSDPAEYEKVYVINFQFNSRDFSINLKYTNKLCYWHWEYQDDHVFDSTYTALIDVIGKEQPEDNTEYADQIINYLEKWASDNIITIYINTYNLSSSMNMNTEEANLFYKYVEEQAKQLGYNIQYVNCLYNDSFSENFINTMFENYLP